MPLAQIEQHLGLRLAEDAGHGHVVAIDRLRFDERYQILRAEPVDLHVGALRIVAAGLSEMPRPDERAPDIVELRDPHRTVETTPRFLDRTQHPQPRGGDEADPDNKTPTTATNR